MAAKENPDHAATVVLDEDYHRDVQSSAQKTLEATACSRTRIVSQELAVDGDRFAWWAVGNGPILVTVSHPVLGRKAEFTSDDPKQFATKLARQLLASA